MLKIVLILIIEGMVFNIVSGAYHTIFEVAPFPKDEAAIYGHKEKSRYDAKRVSNKSE